MAFNFKRPPKMPQHRTMHRGVEGPFERRDADAADILMIAPEPFFEARGTPFSVLGRLKALSHAGHNVDLLTYHVGQDVEIRGLNIFRTPAFPFIREIPVGPSWKKAFLDFFLFAKAFRLLSKKQYDFLHTHEEASFFGVLLAKFYKIPHVYDMHSSLPEQLKNYRLTQSRALIGLFEWLERRVIDSSAIVITVCDELHRYVQDIRQDVPQITIENTLVENGPEHVSQETVKELAAAFSLDGKKVVLYTGTLESYQGVDLLIESAARILCRREDVIFVFVGGKPRQVHRCRQRANDLGLLPHVRFLGEKPTEEISDFVRLASILVSPRVKGKNIPSKIYSYLKSGKPIVATDIVAHRQVLNSEIAVMVPPDPDSLAAGIVSILDNPVLGSQLGVRGREFFEKRYNLSAFLLKTDRAVETALRQNSPKNRFAI